MRVSNPLIEINQKKYLYPPTWSQIEEFINELGVPYEHFERFYGIPNHTLTQVKRGDKRLGAHYWHFIFEKIKPTYGMGYADDYNKELLNEQKAKPKKCKPVTHPINNISTEQHDRISSLK